MNVSNYIFELPDSYDKHEGSNNYKLLSLEQSFVQALRDDIGAVRETLNIYTATGKTLDLYGEMYKQARGCMTDEQYRYIILQRVARNMCGGDYNSIVKSLAVAFGVKPSEFSITEETDPCKVKIDAMPYEVLANAGLSVNQMSQIISAVLPIGVRISNIDLTGTFEFADNATTLDNEKGFGDVEQTIGGYLGYLGDGGTDIPT